VSYDIDDGNGVDDDEYELLGISALIQSSWEHKNDSVSKYGIHINTTLSRNRKL